MPNWCFSQVTIHSEKADVLERELKTALSSNPLKAGFGNEWLGNLLLHIGFDPEEVVRGKVRCRGSVIHWEKTAEDEITMQIESAWSPHVQCIDLFAKRFDLDAEVVYTAEEPRNEVYMTNDLAVAGSYYIDSYILAEKSSREELLNARFGEYMQYEQYIRMLIDYLGLSDTSGETQASLEDKVNEKLRTKNSEFYIYGHKYDLIPMEDCA